MKKTILILAALAGALTWTACQKEQQDPAEESRKPEKAEKTAVLTLKASKGQPGTKALDLDSSGASDVLNVYWKDTEVVKVFKGDACIGTLNVTPGAGEKPTDATLSGNIDVDGIASGDVLSLLIPREVWDYTGQNGALTGDNSLESLFDYSSALVTVSDVTATTLTASDANFENQQSIYRISFKADGQPLVIKSFSIYAKGGTYNSFNQLVKTRTFTSGAWTSTTVGQQGSLEMTPPSPTSDPLYMAIRNEISVDNDTYYFHALGTDGTLYSGSKTIPYAYYSPGHFISMKNISMSKFTIPDMTETATSVY